MSRSKITDDKPTNPAKKFLRWNSDSSIWKYWDKENEEERSIPMATPFIVLDTLSTVTGFNSPKNCRIWANEVRSPKHELRVQDKDGEVAVGPWQTIKEKVSYAKFASSVYAMAKVGDDYELVNFQLSGCSVGPWFDFVKELGGNSKLFGDLAVKVGESKAGKVGRVEFNAPAYTVATRQLSDDARELAKEKDEELQVYLSEYFASSPEGKAAETHSKEMTAYEPPAAPNRDTEPEPMPEEDAPF